MKSKGMSIIKKQPQYRWKARSNVDHEDDDDDDDYHSPFGSASPSRGSFELVRRERKGSFGSTPSTPPHQSYMEHANQLNHSNNINSSHSGIDHRSDGPNYWFELDMAGQGLKTVSVEIRNFSHITALYLSNNKLSSLPDELFSELCNLTTLDMSFNHLTQLPSSIGKLENLRRLAIHQNRIAELPSEVGRLFKLKEMQLDGNPIVSPPPSVLASGVTGIVGYLRDRMPTGTPPPERRFISYIEPTVVLTERERIRVLSYNILAEGYATGYVPLSFARTHARAPAHARHDGH